MQDTIAAAREIDCGFAPHREQGGKGMKPGRMQDTISAAREIVASNCVVNKGEVVAKPLQQS